MSIAYHPKKDIAIILLIVKVSNMIALLWLFLILIPEGSGLYLGRELSRLFIISFPLVGLMMDLIYNRKWRFPMLLSVIWIFFLGLMLLSSIVSSDQGSVFILLFYYLSLYLSFLYFYNHQDQRSHFLAALVICSMFFCVFTSIIYLGLRLEQPFLPIPADGYQFVFSKFGSHNHLGDLLVLTLLITLHYYFVQKEKLLLILAGIFMTFIIGSFSRSAYLSLIVSLVIYLIWQWKKIPRSYLFGIGILIVFLTGLIFIVVKDISTLPVLGEIHSQIKNITNLKDKELSAKRFEFLNQSVQGMIQKPFFGYGPGNFLDASATFTRIGTRTHSAHNILLDTTVELGIPAGIIFIFLLAIILNSQKQNPTFLSLTIIAFIMNSLTDYTYRIYSFLFIFTMFVGFSYKEKDRLLDKTQQIYLFCIALLIVIYTLINL